MMKNIKISILLLTSAFLFGGLAPESEDKVEVMKFDEFEKEWKSWEEGIVVMNFWATWCAPCVKELPYFEQIASKYQDENVKVVLVSLDFVSQLDRKVIPFVKKNNLQSRIILLDAPNYNAWIDKVSEEWSGSIPATMIMKPAEGYSAFYEQEFKYEELETIIVNLK